MITEYKTIQEINGPLMVIRHVEGVTYDELGEIELPSGEKRRCKVLEVNGDNAVVQLFDSSTGINLANTKIHFLGHSLQLVFPKICSDVCSPAWGRRSTAARTFCRTLTGISTACR